MPRCPGYIALKPGKFATTRGPGRRFGVCLFSTPRCFLHMKPPAVRDRSTLSFRPVARQGMPSAGQVWWALPPRLCVGSGPVALGLWQRRFPHHFRGALCLDLSKFARNAPQGVRFKPSAALRLDGRDLLRGRSGLTHRPPRVQRAGSAQTAGIQRVGLSGMSPENGSECRKITSW